MSDISPNIKGYELDTTVSVMNPRTNFGAHVCMDRKFAYRLIHHLVAQLEDESEKECLIYLHGELKED